MPQKNGVWWPLHKWDTKKVGVTSSTYRSAMLGVKYADGETSLKELRAFVASLEKWPDNAVVKHEMGAVIEVSYFEQADSMIKGEN